MKSTKTEISKKKLRARLAISFLGLAGLITFVIFFFYLVRTGEREGGAPVALRRSFLWNEDVSRLLRSNNRLSVDRPRPPKGKVPRFNGSIGLLSPLELKNYVVLVENNDKTLRLSLTDLKLLPKTEHSTEFRCIEGWSEDLQYGGVKFSDFLREYKLGRKMDGTWYNYVGLETPDRQYYVSIDMESMLHEQTLLAWEMNGTPISVKNGAPLRLIIPIKYGIKSLKRIGRIFFSDQRPPDYWAERGYDWYSGL